MILPHELLAYLTVPGLILMVFWCFVFELQENHKIKIDRGQIREYWDHWAMHMDSNHPACGAGRRHIPVGMSGDDARYTLSGAKVIVMMISAVLQEVERNMV